MDLMMVKKIARYIGLFWRTTADTRGFMEFNRAQERHLRLLFWFYIYVCVCVKDNADLHFLVLCHGSTDELRRVAPIMLV